MSSEGKKAFADVKRVMLLWALEGTFLSAPASRRIRNMWLPQDD